MLAPWGAPVVEHREIGGQHQMDGFGAAACAVEPAERFDVAEDRAHR